MVAPVTVSPAFLDHRHGFAGDHGFVHGAAAVDDLAIHRNGLAGANQHHVTDPDDGGRNLFFAILRYQSGLVGLQVQQFFERLAGLAAGAGFQVLAQTDKGDQHGRGLEEDLAVWAEQAEIGQQ